MKAVVLGANGFLGSHLCRRLVDTGWRVTAVVREGGAPRYTQVVRDRAADIELRVGDATDARFLADVLSGADAILPMHGRPGVQAGEDDPVGDLALHATSHLTILRLMRATGSTAHVVYPGSRVQYGVPVRLPVRESDPTLPNSVYAIHKDLAERYYLHHARAYGIAATSLRLSVSYGPHQDTPRSGHGVVGQFIERARRGETIPLHGGGQQARDFLYVDDLMDLFCAVLGSPDAIGRVFNAGGGVAVPLRTLAETITAVVGSGGTVAVPWPPEAARIETGDYVADITTAGQVFGWAPRTGLTDGIRATWMSGLSRPSARR